MALSLYFITSLSSNTICSVVAKYEQHIQCFSASRTPSSPTRTNFKKKKKELFHMVHGTLLMDNIQLWHLTDKQGQPWYKHTHTHIYIYSMVWWKRDNKKKSLLLHRLYLKRAKTTSQMPWCLLLKTVVNTQNTQMSIYSFSMANQDLKF